MDEEYDLVKSQRSVGPLRPVIRDSQGRIVDGIHRNVADPKWPEEVWDNIITDEEYWKTRAHLNYSRRNATEAREEKLRIIDSLAEYYIKLGLKVSGEKPPREGSAGGASPINEVLDAVINALDGAIPEGYIRKNIDPQYTQEQKTSPRAPSDPERKRYRGEPEESIRSHIVSSSSEELADQVLEDFKQKVRESALEDPVYLKAAARTYVEKAHAPISQPRGAKAFEEATPLKDKYLNMMEGTFYKIRGWGIPMMLSMGEKTWDEALWYVEAIHNWTGWLIQISPGNETNPTPPKFEPVDVDEKRIVEAEFQVIE